MPQGLFVHDKLKIVHRVYVSRCAYTQGYIANVNGVAALAVLGTTKNAERHKLHHLTLLRYCAYFEKHCQKVEKSPTWQQHSPLWYWNETTYIDTVLVLQPLATYHASIKFTVTTSPKPGLCYTRTHIFCVCMREKMLTRCRHSVRGCLPAPIRTGEPDLGRGRSQEGLEDLGGRSSRQQQQQQ